VDQLLHAYTKETNCKQIISATGSCSFKAWTTVVLYGHGFKNFVALSAVVVKAPSPVLVI
jgi:hypothetical protein